MTLQSSLPCRLSGFRKMLFMECLEFLPCRFAVRTKFAARSAWRDSITIKRLSYSWKEVVYPGGVAFKWYDSHFEFKLAIKGCRIAAGIRVYKIARRRNHKAVITQKPLVYAHLSTVLVFPGGVIERSNRAGLGSGFVIYDNEFTLRVYPDVVDRAGNRKASFRVLEFHALKILAPRIHVLVLEGNRVDAVLLHKRMRAPLDSMLIEFFLEKSIYGDIEGKGRAAWARGTKLVIKIKAPGTFGEQFY